MACRADNLAAQRLLAGHSISRLAELANVSDWTIEKLENGGSDDQAVIQRIADALGVTATTLGQSDL
jgi:transcriptional regulator with XRE-family HTH domain